MSENTDYTKLIEMLEKERDALTVTIATLRAKAGLPVQTVEGQANALPEKGDNSSQNLPTEVRSDTFFNMSVPSAIKKFLMMSKRPRSANDVVEALKQGGMLTVAKNFYNTVYNAMLREKSTFVKLNEKEWGLVEWYGGRPKPAQPQQKTKPKPKPKRKAKPKPSKSQPTKQSESADTSQKPKPTKS